MLITIFFFFNDTATTEIYTLSLHDALPISVDGGHVENIRLVQHAGDGHGAASAERADAAPAHFGIEFLIELLRDRKSTRLNSSHGYISYAVFCLKKQNTYTTYTNRDNSYHS